MKVLRVIRIETAPDGAVHLITEGGDRVIITRKADGYSAARVVSVTEQEVPDRHVRTIAACGSTTSASAKTGACARLGSSCPPSCCRPCS